MSVVKDLPSGLETSKTSCICSPAEALRQAVVCFWSLVCCWVLHRHWPLAVKARLLSKRQSAHDQQTWGVTHDLRLKWWVDYPYNYASALGEGGAVRCILSKWFEPKLWGTGPWSWLGAGGWGRDWPPDKENDKRTVIFGMYFDCEVARLARREGWADGLMNIRLSEIVKTSGLEWQTEGFRPEYNTSRGATGDCFVC